jgi:hypothetical protein
MRAQSCLHIGCDEFGINFSQDPDFGLFTTCVPSLFKEGIKGRLPFSFRYLTLPRSKLFYALSNKSVHRLSEFGSIGSVWVSSLVFNDKRQQFPDKRYVTDL